MPAIARHEIMNVIRVIGMCLRMPPIFRMSPLVASASRPWPRRCAMPCSMPCMTEPAPRNRHALKNACVPRWKIAASQLPVPAATNMKPSWLTVEYASTFLRSVWANAMYAAASAVSRPIVDTTISAVVDAE